MVSRYNIRINEPQWCLESTSLHVACRDEVCQGHIHSWLAGDTDPRSFEPGYTDKLERVLGASCWPSKLWMLHQSQFPSYRGSYGARPYSLFMACGSRRPGYIFFIHATMCFDPIPLLQGAQIGRRLSTSIVPPSSSERTWPV